MEDLLKYLEVCLRLTGFKSTPKGRSQVSIFQNGEILHFDIHVHIWDPGCRIIFLILIFFGFSESMRSNDCPSMVTSVSSI